MTYYKFLPYDYVVRCGQHRAVDTRCGGPMTAGHQLIKLSFSNARHTNASSIMVRQKEQRRRDKWPNDEGSVTFTHCHTHNIYKCYVLCIMEIRKF